MPITLRTPEMEKKYQNYLKTLSSDYCYFCDYKQKDLIYEGRYWNILVNHFPYDNIFSEHHILAPKRHIPKEGFLHVKELEELRYIKDACLGTNFSQVVLIDLRGYKYDLWMENGKHKQGTPDHLHYHLLKY